jgi:hypothetical protein
MYRRFKGLPPPLRFLERPLMRLRHNAAARPGDSPVRQQ